VLSAGALIAAVIAGVLLSGSLSHAGSRPHTAPPTATSAAGMVEISSSSLAGQPVSAVRRQLQQLGLLVRVLWRPSGQDPGTVLSVQPSGRVPAGIVIAITAASQLQPGGHGHGHGDGQGNGNNGDGGD
jgi:hypothetical protein